MRRLTLVLTVLLVLALAGCSILPVKEREAVYQVSTINALLQGLYDGELSLGQLKSKGDLGIGTFDKLDGEMVLLDGRVYKVRADGRASIAPDEETTPFAAVTCFEPDREVRLKGVKDYQDLTRLLDGLLVNRNTPHAIRIDGVFAYVKARSVPPQNRPYPPLTQVAAKQPTFEFKEQRGTLVGFWCPAFVEGINVTGYHLHFLTEDRRQGGHVLECAVQDAVAQVDYTPQFHLVLPQGSDFARADLASDRRQETAKVEK